MIKKKIKDHTEKDSCVFSFISASEHKMNTPENMFIQKMSACFINFCK